MFQLQGIASALCKSVSLSVSLLASEEVLISWASPSWCAELQGELGNLPWVPGCQWCRLVVEMERWQNVKCQEYPQLPDHLHYHQEKAC